MRSPLLLAALLLTAPAAATEAPSKPWRVHQATGAPDWLWFGAEQRTRFEHLAHDFRAAHEGNATALALRTSIAAELRLAPLALGVEVQDSRMLATEGAPLDTTHVDPLDVLQAYVRLKHSAVLDAGDEAQVTLGRFTMSLGSQRLVSRNDFRNTNNNFTGIDLSWTTAARQSLRAFVVWPVVRLPSEPDALADHRLARDRESTRTVFWGTFHSLPLPSELELELYVFGLHERDEDFAPSTNRRLVTPGARLLRAPKAGQLDFQFEPMVQVGTSRASRAVADRENLSHRAASTHASVGYRFDAPWTPRVVVQHDYASGDREPNDGENNRFSPLFGTGRFEFGPSGLFGTVARANLHSPGLRVEAEPHAQVDAFVAYRPFWLASKRDAWTTAGMRDPTGDSGSFIGHQLEARVRWHAVPKNLALELGAAHLARGEFAKSAPGGRSEPSSFAYGQVTLTL
ncbi:MAG: alginate export family protein [Polyangiaceae bacterium]|nr:alginate export family protein [Polyangiaceae bacterium]